MRHLSRGPDSSIVECQNSSETRFLSLKEPLEYGAINLLLSSGSVYAYRKITIREQCGLLRKRGVHIASAPGS